MILCMFSWYGFGYQNFAVAVLKYNQRTHF
uniref:Uncharacterized protein n=1 Tax=Arundo donax TaxID=35708 RepID=A0A0A9AI64_ARUDO